MNAPITPQAMLSPADQIAAIPKDPPKPTTHALYQRKWRANNREKSNQHARDYRAKNPDKVRSFNLKKTYGITLDQFNDLFRLQGGVCAICKGGTSGGKNWHVDHCHETEKIRGILCHNCNLMIGQAEDNVETLLAAVEYLKARR